MRHLTQLIIIISSPPVLMEQRCCQAPKLDAQITLKIIWKTATRHNT